MYPRNAANPSRIAIGQVIDADGVVQTSGVVVKVIPQGGSEATGNGTVAYSADGVVLYSPTREETDCEAFCLVASKPGSYAASVTVVTSPLDISSGKVAARLDWQADVTNKPTIGTSTLTTEDVASIEIESGITLKQALRADLAMLVGEVSGCGTGTEEFKAAGNDSITRVIVEADEFGNRSSVTLTL
jgi:hypothetical protein